MRLFHLFLLWVAHCGASSTVTPFPVTPGAVLDNKATLTVDGSLVISMEKQASSDVRAQGPPPRPSSRAHFAADTSVRCNLTFSRPLPALPPVLRRQGAEIEVTADTRTYSYLFTLSPDHYYMRVDGYDGWFYFWIEPTAGLHPAGNITNVRDLGVLPNTGAALTDQLQQIFNNHTAAASTLLFPQGEYLSDTLNITMPGLHIHLAPGAVIRYKGEKMPYATDRGFLTVSETSGTRLTGGGTIDSNCYAGHSLYVYHARDVEVHGILIMGSQGWAVPIRQSSSILFHGVKVFSGADGFDPDASQDVTIDHAFVNSWDDAVAVKNTVGMGHFTERITVRHSVVSTRKSALKIGTESLDNFINISFHDVDVFDTDRGVVLYAEDGGGIYNASWRNLHMTFYDYLEESKAGRAFDFMLRDRHGLSQLHNVRVQNVVTDVVCSSYFVGTQQLPLGNITFSNISLRVAAKNHVVRSQMPYLFDCGDEGKHKVSDSVVMQGVQIDWGQESGAWQGVSQAHPGNATPAHPFALCVAQKI